MRCACMRCTPATTLSAFGGNYLWDRLIWKLHRHVSCIIFRIRDTALSGRRKGLVQREEQAMADVIIGKPEAAREHSIQSGLVLRSLGEPNSVRREFDFWDDRYEGRRLFSELLGTFMLVTVAVGGSIVNARF